MRAASAYPAPRRLKDPENIEFFKALTLAGDFDLDKDEVEWRDRYEFLESHGYRLRPRFRKDWKPSWLGTDLHPHDCEDSHGLTNTRLIDATRISDGKRVVLKRVRRRTMEIGLVQSLRIKGRAEDPDNHCVPILEYFDDMEDQTLGYLVMPLLRSFDSPSFAFTSEIVDFIRQTLRGLKFLHTIKIAHRDLSGLNIMMDGEPLYPTGFHPSHQTLNPVGSDFAKHLNRRDVRSIKYYIIDYGNSSAFDSEGKIIKHFGVSKQSSEIVIDEDGPSEDPESNVLDPERLAALKARMREIDPNVDLEGIEDDIPQPVVEDLPPFTVTGRDALDREVPELSSHIPYDPFLVDIFTLGNVYKKNFLQKYSNLGFLSSLSDSMTQTDPKMRPSVEEAIQHFESITSGMSRFQLCLPLRLVEAPLGRYSIAVGDLKATIRESWELTKDNFKKLLLLSRFRRRGPSGELRSFPQN